MHTPTDVTPNINLTFIVGFMGSGKTTWGKKLAQALGYQFVDLDHLIVEKISTDIPSFFKAHGENEFRDLETQTLRNLPTDKPTIVSTGGGTPCFHDNMEWMNEVGQTIYFKLSSEQLWQRLNKPKHINTRPALKGLKDEELLGFIAEKLDEREPFYTQAAHIIDHTTVKLENLVALIAPPNR